MMKIGSIVQIVEDEFPEMVGLLGTITRFSGDNTTAIVMCHGIGVWCSLSNLIEVWPDENLG